MRSTLILSLFAVGVVGCGDHGGGNSEDMAMSGDLSAELDMTIPDDAKTIVTFTMFAQDYAQAYCAYLMRCGQLDAAQLSICLEKNILHTGWDQDVEIMKGRVEINQLQCLNALAMARCDSSDSGEWLSRCAQFLYTGHQAAGAACLANVECSAGYCQHAGSDAGVSEQATGCPGMCAAAKAAGAACRVGTDCGPTAYCSYAGPSPICVTRAAMGEACVNDLGGGSGQPCQFGLMCPNFPTTASPMCVIPSMQTAVGGACDPFQGGDTPTPPCAAGMYCQLQYTVTTTVCTVVGNECAAIAGGYCDTTTLKCQQPSAGKCAMKIAAAAACDPNNDGVSSFVNGQCADGTTCLQLTGQSGPTCQALSGANGNCNDDSSCKTGLYCNGSGKCTPLIADGQACNSAAPRCSSELNSCIVDNPDAGTATSCEPTKNVGSACIPGFEDALCEPADVPGSSGCAANGTGGGTCLPRCY